MQKEFEYLGGKIDLGRKISLEINGNEICETTNFYDAEYIINAAGAQADRISRAVNVGLEFAMLPFMGTYRTTEVTNLPLQRLVYPVPNPLNPFLGVHLTVTTDAKIKIGPTAIPVFGREQYTAYSGWSGMDIAQAFKAAQSITKNDRQNFSSIIKQESPKILQRFLISESTKLVPSAGLVRNWKKSRPGIRAQLVHVPTGQLVQDFVVQKKLNTTHVLNAVSPGWTSALPFGEWVVDNL